jgi:hypothetical protein
MQTTTQSEAKELILTDLDISQDYRQPYEIQAIRGYKQYLGYRKELKNKDRSNLHIPVMYRIIDTIRSRVVKTVAGNRPYVDAVVKPGPGASPELMAANEEKAKIPASLIDIQLEQNRFAQMVYDFTTAKLIFPATIMGLCWRKDEEKVKKRVQFEALGLKFPFAVTKESKEVTFDDNELIYVDFFDYWPDPWGGSLDLRQHNYGIHREWLTKEQIERKLEFYKKQQIGEVFMPTEQDWKNIADVDIPDNRFDRVGAIGMPVPDNQSIQSDNKGNYRNRRYALYNHWTRDGLKLIINKTFVPFIGENPYWRHRQIPFMMQSYEQLPGEVYGRSLAFFEYYLQEELNTIVNQRVDNISLIINCMWKKKRGTLVDDSQLVSRPGGIVEVDNMDEIEQLVFHDVTAPGWTHQQDVIGQMEDAVGSPAIVQGIDGGTSQTATEITSQNSNASIRFDVKVIVDSDGWKRLFGLMDMNNQQFITDERLVKIFGQAGSKDEWRKIGPLDLIGFERDYQMSNARVDPAANKEVRRQQLWEALVNGKQAQLNLDFDAIAFEWLKTFDFANPEKYQLQPEQIQQQMMQMLQMQQAQAQQAQQVQADQAQQEQAVKAQEQDTKFKQEIFKTVIQILGKLAEKNPAILGQLTQLAGGMQTPGAPVAGINQEGGGLGGQESG